MGKIILLTDEMPELLPMMNRSEGIHVSSIINQLCIDQGVFKDDRSMDRGQAELGCALEYAITRRLELTHPDRYVSVGEIEKDGIFGTPDLIDCVDGWDNEIKLTWMSSNHKPDSDKFWRYWAQVKAYSYMMGLDRGKLRVCHIMGDYRGCKTAYREWGQKFSRQELLENWITLLSKAETMRKEL
jgi:hypothetical protein